MSTHIQSAVPTGDGLWPLSRHMWWRYRKVAAFARLCVFGGLCIDMWRLVHQWSFFCCLTVFWLFLTNGTHKTMGVAYKSSQVYQDCTNSVPTVNQSSKTVKTQSKQHKNDHWYTSRHMSTKTVSTVYQCSVPKTVIRQTKQQKNDHWCTNRHRSTNTVPTV